jgi:DNA-binding LacI/PurR family transcriptional regulator
LKTVPAYIRIAEQIKADWFPSNAPQQGQKLPTQEEMADRYNVSRSTIVRVMSRLVAEGYMHSRQGSGGYVASRQNIDVRTKCLSLIVPDLHAPVIIAACRGVERKARQRGYQVLLASSESDLSCEQELVGQHIASGAQGVLLYPVVRTRRQLLNDYLVHWNQDIPIVTMDIACEEWNCSQVLFDNFQLGYDMTHQLLQSGKRHILFMQTSVERLHSSIHERQRGWEAALQQAGYVIPAQYRDWLTATLDMSRTKPMSEVDYEGMAEVILKLTPSPDAIIARNDVAAAYLIQALINQGIQVPNEIEVTGFDNEPLITRLFRPQIPTSKPSFSRLGEVAVETLEALLSGDRSRTRQYQLPVPLLWREPLSGGNSLPEDTYATLEEPVEAHS